MIEMDSRFRGNDEGGRDARVRKDAPFPNTWIPAFLPLSRECQGMTVSVKVTHLAEMTSFPRKHVPGLLPPAFARGRLCRGRLRGSGGGDPSPDSRHFESRNLRYDNRVSSERIAEPFQPGAASFGQQRLLFGPQLRVAGPRGPLRAAMPRLPGRGR